MIVEQHIKMMLKWHDHGRNQPSLSNHCNSQPVVASGHITLKDCRLKNQCWTMLNMMGYPIPLTHIVCSPPNLVPLLIRIQDLVKQLTVGVQFGASAFAVTAVELKPIVLADNCVSCCWDAFCCCQCYCFCGSCCCGANASAVAAVKYAVFVAALIAVVAQAGNAVAAFNDALCCMVSKFGILSVAAMAVDLKQEEPGFEAFCIPSVPIHLVWR